MNFELDYRPDYTFLRIDLERGESLKAETSAMAAMDEHIDLQAKLKGGLSRFLTGETLFLNTFKAEQAPGSVWIAPGPVGDILHIPLSQTQVFATSGSYLASADTVKLETKWQGMMKGFFSGESFFLMRCSGPGDLWLNSYGAIEEIEVNGDFVVDNGHIVAFEETLDYDIGRIGGYKSLFFSGEGLVCKFRGQGKVWIQTRRPSALVAWADRFRPVKARTGN